MRPARRAIATLLAAATLGACTPAASGIPSAGNPSPPSATSTPSQPGASPVGTAAVPTDTPQPGATAPAAAAWARLEIGGDEPAAREDHTWTVAEDGRAYLFGGRDGPRVFDDLWAFDLAAERWERLAIDGPAPRGRFGHEAAWLPGHGLVIWAGQAGADFFDDVWVLEPSDLAWQRLDASGGAPVARYGSCSGVGPDGRFWISHGFTANGVRFDDTRTLDVENARWADRSTAGNLPVERCLHVCWWTSDGRLALYGGQTNGVPALGDLWFLTRGTGDGATWSEAPGQPARARHLPAVARRGSVTFIVGGRGESGRPLADAWLLPDDAAALIPLDAPDGPAARSGAAMVHDAEADRLILFGGRDDAAFADAWELSFS